MERVIGFRAQSMNPKDRMGNPTAAYPLLSVFCKLKKMRDAQFLFKEIPLHTDPDHKVPVGVVWSSQEVVACPGRVEMLALEVNSRRAYFHIEEEIEHREVADFLLVLHVEFADYGIVIVRIILGEVIERDAGLDKKRFFEIIVLEVQCISGHELWDVDDVAFLVGLLVKHGIV